MSLRTIPDHGFADEAPLRRRIVAFFAAVLDGIRDGRRMAAVHHELSRLSRTELARRGLTRDDIVRVALMSAGSK